MPFLEEHEWEIISPLLKDSMLKIKEYRMEHDCDLATAKLNYNTEASIQFEKVTGYKDVYVGSIFHLRLKDISTRVKWDLVMLNINQFCWHRTDWAPHACTKPMSRCTSGS